MRCTMQTSDIMIHVNEQLEANSQQELETEVRKLEGVIAPRFNQAHLLLVSYNPEKTSSSAILGIVKAKGYTAQLVGM